MMKGYVYILKSENGRYYIGSTNNIERRFYAHQHKHTHTTTRMGRLELAFSQEFATLSQARAIEKKIKSWKRKDFIEKIISDGNIRSI